MERFYTHSKFCSDLPFVLLTFSIAENLMETVTYENQFILCNDFDKRLAPPPQLVLVVIF